MASRNPGKKNQAVPATCKNVRHKVAEEGASVVCTMVGTKVDVICILENLIFWYYGTVTWISERFSNDSIEFSVRFYWIPFRPSGEILSAIMPNRNFSSLERRPLTSSGARDENLAVEHELVANVLHRASNLMHLNSNKSERSLELMSSQSTLESTVDGTREYDEIRSVQEEAVFHHPPSDIFAISRGISSRNSKSHADELRPLALDARAPLTECVMGMNASTEIPGLSTCDLAHLPSNYSAIGQRNPILTRVLQPGESLKAEPGSLVTMDRGIDTTTGD